MTTGNVKNCWTHYTRLLPFWLVLAGFGLCLGSLNATGAIINLQAYVLLSIYDETGTTALADGSIVQIIGSFDDVIDPPASFGSNLTGGTTGDDIIIATITIDSSILGIPGTFFAGDIFFESDDVKYMYLRFYNTDSLPLSGTIYWGESMITNAEHHAFGVLEMDFVGGFSTTEQDTFVVIPEPATMQLLFIALLAVGGYYYHVRTRIAPLLVALVQRDPEEPPPPTPPPADLDPRWDLVMAKIERYFLTGTILLVLVFIGICISLERATVETLFNAVMLALIIAGPIAVIIACEQITRSTEFIHRFRSDEPRDFL